MKISKQALRKIIKEEIVKTLNEAPRQAGAVDVHGISKVIGQAAKPLMDKYGPYLTMLALQSIEDPSNLEIHGPHGYTGIDMPLKDFTSQTPRFYIGARYYAEKAAKEDWERKGYPDRHGGSGTIK